MHHIRLVVCAGILLAMSGAAEAQQDFVNTFAGGGPNNVLATTADALTPMRVAVDSAGNFYYTTFEQGQSRVFKVNRSTGILTVVAGYGLAGYSGDGGPATAASLAFPSGIAVDSQGNVFVADTGNAIVRKVNVGSGIINTIAGIPNNVGYSGDSGPATSAELDLSDDGTRNSDLAIDKNGNLFIADEGNNRIRVVSCATVTSTGGNCAPNSGQTGGFIYTVAGNGIGGYNGEGILATSAELGGPTGVTTDSAGNLYISESPNARVRRVACGTGISGCISPAGETSGNIYTLAGNGTHAYNGDGIPAATAELDPSGSLSVDNSGNLFIGDTYNARIRMVACATVTSSGSICIPGSGLTSGDIYTVAGNGGFGYNGDNQAATAAALYDPEGIAVDSSGDLFITESSMNGDRVREVPCQNISVACTPPTGETAGFMYTAAGNGTIYFTGNNIPATDAQLFPDDAVSDSAGNIYIADSGDHVVRVVSASTGLLSTFAGAIGSSGYSGDGGPATSALLSFPSRILVDGSDNVYIVDGNCVIREVSNGIISTVVGHLGCGFGGDGGPATSALLNEPTGIAFDRSGNLYISDSANERIRKVSGGIISTFAGTGKQGFSGDNGPATNATLAFPRDVATDAAGNVYIADDLNNRIRKVNPSGIISTYAGNHNAGYQGDGVPATSTSLYSPEGIAIDPAGDLLIVDQLDGRIRLVDAKGIIHTIAGNGSVGPVVQGVLATTTGFDEPGGVGIDPSGNIYVISNSVIFTVNALAILNPSPANLTFGLQAVHTTSNPMVVTLTSAGPATISSITASANFHETDDCPGSLSAGATCTIQVTFSPVSAGAFTGKVTVNYNGFFESAETVTLKGTGTNYEIFGRTSVTFPTQVVNTTSANTKVTFKYTGTGTLTLNGLTPSANFAVNTAGITSGACNLSGTTSLAQFGSCAFNVAFSPTSVGTINGNVTASFSGDPGGNTSVKLPLTGTATEVTLSPTALAFGMVASGMKNETLTVTNKGATTLTFNGTPSISGTGAGQFSVLPNTGGNSTCLSGTPVAQNGSCTFTVQFTSTGGGISYSETMSITDNGGASPQTVKITAKD